MDERQRERWSERGRKRAREREHVFRCLPSFDVNVTDGGKSIFFLCEHVSVYVFVCMRVYMCVCVCVCVCVSA